jgi:hypothetical protein
MAAPFLDVLADQHNPAFLVSLPAHMASNLQNRF